MIFLDRSTKYVYTYRRWPFEWDEAKSLRNKAKHGLAFGAIADFEWHKALVLVDDRRNYGEERRYAIGRLYGRFHVVVYTRRNGKTLIISLRRAHEKEIALYEKTHDTPL